MILEFIPYLYEICIWKRFDCKLFYKNERKKKCGSLIVGRRWIGSRIELLASIIGLGTWVSLQGKTSAEPQTTRTITYNSSSHDLKREFIDQVKYNNGRPDQQAIGFYNKFQIKNVIGIQTDFLRWILTSKLFFF